MPASAQVGWYFWVKKVLISAKILGSPFVGAYKSPVSETFRLLKWKETLWVAEHDPGLFQQL